ncbi:MAG: hypothetical protein IJ767_07745 [Bacteroidaceae bacterium]|nr:hypothetical protein [Bacteroidaceae bacterium]
MKSYIKIAKRLGIVIPACLMTSPVESKAANVADFAGNEATVVSEDNVANPNPVKDRIVQSFNLESTVSPYQIGHTNIHANYRIPHTNVHSDYMVQNRHSNQHSNTSAKHVNDHSNSKI